MPLATATSLTAESIACSYGRFAIPLMEGKPVDYIVSGGGARNRTLMRMLAARLEPMGCTMRALLEEFGPCPPKPGRPQPSHCSPGRRGTTGRETYLAVTGSVQTRVILWTGHLCLNRSAQDVTGPRFCSIRMRLKPAMEPRLTSLESGACKLTGLRDRLSTFSLARASTGIDNGIDSILLAGTYILRRKTYE